MIYIREEPCRQQNVGCGALLLRRLALGSCKYFVALRFFWVDCYPKAISPDFIQPPAHSGMYFTTSQGYWTSNLNPNSKKNISQP
jgi:hypothetical protein